MGISRIMETSIWINPENEIRIRMRELIYRSTATSKILAEEFEPLRRLFAGNGT